jgi:universal stress protein A
MHKNILVAVDLDEKASLLLAKAQQLAAISDAKVTVLNVIESLANLYIGDDWLGGGVNIVELQTDLLQQREKQLKALLKDWPGLKGLQRQGSPAAEIRDCATELGADLIIIGTHGRHGLELLLGSISNGVLHGTPCDVLAVKI